MITKDKLQDLNKQIEEKAKTLDMLKEQRRNSNEPEEMVSLDKAIDDTAKILDALERTKKAVTYMPPKPTDKQQLTAGLNKYLSDKKQKIQEAERVILATAKELQAAESKLSAAINEGDVDSLADYSDKCEELKKRLKYAKQIKAAAENAPAFPDGVIQEEWARICKEKRPDVKALLERIGLLAEEYRAACDELLNMKRTLIDVRREMRQMAQKDGKQVTFPQILTTGINTSALAISQTDGKKPNFFACAGIGENPL